ncbi:hypothetical protein ACFWDA_02705 [Rhodococcus zopfii]|uniref:hypothetical protein n=1 Tax=Rhodococcus zopfii TaxID=43772 RepID=UPI0014753A8F|nr:hypothetical protein [Rhodococcus zopfii]
MNRSLFYDPMAKAGGADSIALPVVASPAVDLPRPEQRTAEEIHRALFSAQ